MKAVCYSTPLLEDSEFSSYGNSEASLPLTFAGLGGAWTGDGWVASSKSHVECSACANASRKSAWCCLKSCFILAPQCWCNAIYSLECVHKCPLNWGQAETCLIWLWYPGPRAHGRSRHDSCQWGRKWTQTIASFCQPSRPILSEPTWPPVRGPGALKEHGACWLHRDTASLGDAFLAALPFAHILSEVAADRPWMPSIARYSSFHKKLGIHI